MTLQYNNLSSTQLLLHFYSFQPKFSNTSLIQALCYGFITEQKTSISKACHYIRKTGIRDYTYGKKNWLRIVAWPTCYTNVTILQNILQFVTHALHIKASCLRTFYF